MANTLDLGNFSVSLKVSDIDASLKFYESFGLKVIDGGHMNEGFPYNGDSKWRILQSGKVVIGLFQETLPGNIITMNPLDVRAVQKNLVEQGIEVPNPVDESTTGPASIMLTDPDGNVILLDQHQ